MSNPGPGGGGDIFEVKRVRRLVELMKEHDLGEIDLRQGEQRIRIRRGIDFPAGPAVAPAAHSSSAAPPATASGATPPAAPASDAGLEVIKSPMVGTFYSAPNPESPAFVKVGDHIGADSVVCIIEAMKVFNEIQAEVAGKIAAILVENGQPVEFGQPLFKVETHR